MAALPVALNWTAVNRRDEPEASMAQELAAALLEPLPPRAVLFVAGDNDTYPLWYAQAVEGMRRDVTVVTLPLLGAEWYVDELQRRWHLGSTGAGLPERVAPRVAASAEMQGRPIAVALTVSAADRNRLADGWKVIGLVALADGKDSSGLNGRKSRSTVIQVDTVAVSDQAQRLDRWASGRVARPQTDPVQEYYGRVLNCPRMLLSERTAVVAASLDSLCNLR